MLVINLHAHPLPYQPPLLHVIHYLLGWLFMIIGHDHATLM